MDAYDCILSQEMPDDTFLGKILPRKRSQDWRRSFSDGEPFALLASSNKTTNSGEFFRCTLGTGGGFDEVFPYIISVSGLTPS